MVNCYSRKVVRGLVLDIYKSSPLYLPCYMFLLLERVLVILNDVSLFMLGWIFVTWTRKYYLCCIYLWWVGIFVCMPHIEHLNKTVTRLLRLNKTYIYHYIVSLWYVTLSPMNTLKPEQNGWHFAGDIFKCIFIEWEYLHFDSNFCLFIMIQFILNQCWFSWWLDAEQVTSHYLKQRCLCLLTHICVTRRPSH